MTPFSEFVLTSQRKYGGSGNLSHLLRTLVSIGKAINFHVNNAGLLQLIGAAGTTNTHGEDQQHLDVFAHHLFLDRLAASGLVFMIGSEEEDTIIPVAAASRGERVVVIDPLDGSSVIGSNTTIGSIVGIYRRKNDDPNDVVNLLQPARDLEAAMIILYGPSTKMILSVGHGVHVFTLNMGLGEFILDPDGEDVKIPPLSKISTYSFNYGNIPEWDPRVQEYATWLRDYQISGTGAKLTFRYIGSLCADFYRTLCYGGMFAYPGTIQKPPGKLRLLYENGIMAFLMEQAGGIAVSGIDLITSLVPKKLHERTPLFFGDKVLMEELVRRLS